MFTNTTPEAVGIQSEKVLELIKNLEEARLQTHSIIMARGNEIFAETYYKPFHKDFLHRMYSASKTFVAIAVGLAVTEGLMSLDDVVVDYFPEFRNEKTDEFYDECTVLDMLRMQSNFAGPISWWGKYKSRVEAYYDQQTKKIPGTVYYYDSIGSFLLGCIVEKLTGKTFLQYLKEKILLDMGFSEDSYTLKEPGGFTVGDSGVMCTARDLAIFARLMMQKGEWNGKQYIDRDFMEKAITKQSYNDLNGGFDNYSRNGYGYLTRITGENSFALMGLGDQYAICDMENDFLFVITSDNQIDDGSKNIIFREVLKYFVPYIEDKPLCENEKAYKKLRDYMESRELISQYGNETSPIAMRISGAEYQALENPQGISTFCLELEDGGGSLTLTKDGCVYRIPFGIGKNNLCSFSFGTRPVPDMMGKDEEGEYECAVSGAWVDKNTFSVKLQVIDTYFGGLNILISFKDTRRAVLYISKSGQYVFEDIGGYVICNRKK